MKTEGKVHTICGFQKSLYEKGCRIHTNGLKMEDLYENRGQSSYYLRLSEEFV